MMRDSGELRQRRQVLTAVKELDAFPKVPEGYQETTAAGGGFSIIVFCIIAILVISEIKYYSTSELEFDYEVDNNFDGKLKINIDMTIAMKCNNVGADVLDLTGQNVAMAGKLEEKSVHFDLSPNQRASFISMQSINRYLSDEYHAIHKFLWKTGYSSMSSNLPQREEKPTTPPDGCQLTGTLEVNKVAGNFHITAGKSVPVFPRGHAHLAMMVKDTDYNFSHRINHLSFGESVPGRINQLDGEEKITDANYHMYQYFVQVVPTTVASYFTTMDSYQFAVTEKNRTINHASGSHGVPGIFMKYDLSALKVKVKETYKPYWKFLVRLCGIVGGIFATSGVIHGIVNCLYDLICCKYKVGKYVSPLPRSISNSEPPSPATPTSSLITNTPDVALLSQSPGNNLMQNVPLMTQDNYLPNT